MNNILFGALLMTWMFYTCMYVCILFFTYTLVGRLARTYKKKKKEDEKKTPHNGYCVHIQLWMTFTRFVQYRVIVYICEFFLFLLSFFFFFFSLSFLLPACLPALFKCVHISIVWVWCGCIVFCCCCFAVPCSFYIRFSLTYMKVHLYCLHVSVVRPGLYSYTYERIQHKCCHLFDDNRICVCVVRFKFAIVWHLMSAHTTRVLSVCVVGNFGIVWHRICSNVCMYANKNTPNLTCGIFANLMVYVYLLQIHIYISIQSFIRNSDKIIWMKKKSR